ncbi:hypothetical protein [Flavobacterium sp.]|uniref:hypothetical protein n=1 Tax=Flavobacterium sp. TaxID=239 RepID=UPI00120F3F72|nr:hypothetical protein [Flavobacterium sp.]RZJ71747.1 MAG: hypothetical protein EOO49_08775 [Flavobacterium sp.]
MKKFLITLIILATVSTFGQTDPALTGKWKTIEASDSTFHVRNDTITFPKSYKPYSGAALQDKRAGILMDYAKNIFVFTPDNGFQLFLTEDPRTLNINGKYKISEKGKLLLKVTYNPKMEIEKRAEYFFKDGKLHLKMHAERQEGVDYVLEKI